MEMKINAKRRKIKNRKMKEGNEDIPVYRKREEMNGNGWKKKLLEGQERQKETRKVETERNNKMIKKTCSIFLQTMSTWVNSLQRKLN
jgi:hypothetical protein